jgi:hypothetical protein
MFTRHNLVYGSEAAQLRIASQPADFIRPDGDLRTPPSKDTLPPTSPKFAPLYCNPSS